MPVTSARSRWSAEVVTVVHLTRANDAHIDRSVGSRTDPVALGRRIVGGFYLSMGGVHLGIVAADPETYGPFADRGIFAFVRDGWADIVMANPSVWGLLLFLGETVIGTLLMVGGRFRKPGWVLVVAFHLLLVLFGWQILLWVVPFLAVVGPLAVADWRRPA